LIANNGDWYGVIPVGIIGFVILFGIVSFVNSIKSDAENKQPIVKKYLNEGYSFSKPGN
jgi:hypothetical protein